MLFHGAYIGRLPPANDKEGGDPAIILTSPPLDTQIRTRKKTEYFCCQQETVRIKISEL
jgi:hypothetical protein